MALLARAGGHGDLRLRDVEQRHHPGADVAHYTDSGTLAYSFTDTLVPCIPITSHSLRGALFLTGAILAAYNVWMTIRHAPEKRPERDYPTSSEAAEPPSRQRSDPMFARSSPPSPASSNSTPGPTTAPSGTRWR